MRLTPKELQVVGLIAEGADTPLIMQLLNMSRFNLQNRKRSVYRKLGIGGTGSLKRMKLAYYWNCELYQIGLKELGFIQ